MRGVITLVAALGALAAICSNSLPQPGAQAAPAIEVAPMPRMVEDTRVGRAGIENWAEPANTNEAHKNNGIEWRVNVEVRRLDASTRDVLDFNWRMKYTGPRPPLIILRPSLTDSWPETTQVTVFAFPAGSKEGRVMLFETTEPEKGAAVDWILHGPPKNWYITAKKGTTETGTVTLAVADIKEVLRNRYPTEFSERVPPKLFVEMIHQPSDRGVHYDFDAWTGDLYSKTLVVPDLKSW